MLPSSFGEENARGFEGVNSASSLRSFAVEDRREQVGSRFSLCGQSEGAKGGLSNRLEGCANGIYCEWRRAFTGECSEGRKERR